MALCLYKDFLCIALISAIIVASFICGSFSVIRPGFLKGFQVFTGDVLIEQDGFIMLRISDSAEIFWMIMTLRVYGYEIIC